MINENERKVFERAPFPLALYLHEGGGIRAVLVSDGFCELVSVDRETLLDILNTRMYASIHPEDVNWMKTAAEEFLGKCHGYDILYRLRLVKDGAYHLIHAQAKWLDLMDGSEVGIVIYSDLADASSGIDHLYSFSDNTNNLLNHDTVTGLPNLNYMRQFSEEKVRMLRLLEKRPALVYLDMLSLQSYNAQYGYTEGDALLKLVADQLHAVFPDGLVTSGADDHFLVIDAFESETAAETAIRTLNEQVRRKAKGNAPGIRAGVCVVGPDMAVTTCIDGARRALHEIGSDLNVLCKFYSGELDEESWKQHYIIDNFDEALKNHWIRVFYQGIVRTKTERITLLESLARWNDPNLGAITPGEFIPVLSKYHQLYRLDLYMVEEICREYGIRKEAGLPMLPVTVNFSAQDFDHEDIPTRINEILDRYGVGRDNLIIEITEQDLARGADHFRDELSRLRADGYKLWIDDFGSGYSSLNVLWKYGIDRIKFDMDLLQHLDENNGANRRLLRAFVNVCRELGVHTLAEGVETEEQLRFLQEIDCEMAQGFYLYRPNSLETSLYKLKITKRAHNFETTEERQQSCDDWLGEKNR